MRIKKKNDLRGTVDLSKCKKGDFLVSAFGEILIYVGPTRKPHQYAHVVEYLSKNLGVGTRTNDGYVMHNNRDPEIDQDIVMVFHNS